MEQPVFEKEKTKPSLLWNVIRWLPLGSMLLAAMVLLAMLLTGGMIKISGWYLLQLIPPLLESPA